MLDFVEKQMHLHFMTWRHRDIILGIFKGNWPIYEKACRDATLILLMFVHSIPKYISTCPFNFTHHPLNTLFLGHYIITFPEPFSPWNSDDTAFLLEGSSWNPKIKGVNTFQVLLACSLMLPRSHQTKILSSLVIPQVLRSILYCTISSKTLAGKIRNMTAWLHTTYVQWRLNQKFPKCEGCGVWFLTYVDMQ